jgi:hypothetical protein
MRESDTYGFMGVLEDGELTVSDCFGGGRSFDAGDSRGSLIRAVAAFVIANAENIAEEIIDELDAGDDSDGDDDDD